MYGYFIAGLVLGFVGAFWFIKRQIAKDGAGQLKCCQSCPYFNAPIPQSEVDNNNSEV